MSVPHAKVGDLAEQVRGVSYAKQDASLTPQSGYVPVLRANNITDNGLVFDDLVFVPVERVSEKQRVQQHDVVIATSSGSLDVVGKAAVALADFEGGFGAFCKVLRPNSKVHPVYFSHFFKTRHYRQRVSALAAGANINNLRNEHLDELEIPLPPLAEQQRIAAILDQAEALRAKRRHALAQLNTLTQSLFLEMFGDPTAKSLRFPIHPLESLLSQPLQNGAYFPKESYAEDSGVEMVHMSDAFYGAVVRGNLKRVACGSDEREKYALSENDILIARRSLNYEGAAKPCLIPKSDEPLIFESSLIRVTPAPSKICVLYLFHYLNNARVRQRCIYPFVTQSTIAGINQSNLSRVPVITPPLPLQRKFATQVSAVERLKTAQRTSLAKLDALFASLQHRAFRGEL